MTLRSLALVASLLLLSPPARPAEPAHPPNPGYHIVGTLPLPAGAIGNAVMDLNTRQMLIALGRGGVAALDLDLQTVRGGFVAGSALSSVAAPQSAGDDAVTDDAAGTTHFFDRGTGKVLATVKTGAKPSGAVFDAKTGLLVVVNEGGDTVVVDPAKHSAGQAISLGGTPAPQLAGNATGLIYIGRADGSEIEVLDPAAAGVTRHLPLKDCAGLRGLAYADDSDGLIAACGNKSVTVLAASSGAVVTAIAIGAAPGEVLFDRDRHMALIPEAGGSLAAIALDEDGSARWVQTVQIPIGIRNGAIDPVTGRVFLLAPGPTGNSMVVLDPA